MTIEIGAARADDGDALGEIHAAGWIVYEPFFEPSFYEKAVAHRREKWHAVLAEGTETVLLARIGERPLAFSYFGPSAHRASAAEIYGFYGHPDGWGSGIAAALMAATLSRMERDGFASVHLWTLRDTPQSRRFYRKTGFVESGESRLHDFGDGGLIDQVEYVRRVP
ncbi:GNAT family N-acetyltransferase [Herbidospora cretacea]|uniref:GNAT family N-acetyltransferase n=1 Tax=Herbidospora cretacea TaxID=28444 RepID=UPI0004C31B92|nr:GNAT family N-acetyltransferase [Herbidospora cretacea]